MPQLLGAASCCFGGHRSFRIVRLTRPAYRFDEALKRGVDLDALQPRYHHRHAPAARAAGS
jgi:hypothetical protein